jgi:hypothetical protein
MTEPTNTEKARYIVERTGGCSHERKVRSIRQGWLCTCGKWSCQDQNPTFLDPAGRIQLLELMMGRDDYYDFVHDLHWTQQTSTNRGDELLTIPIVYLTTNQDPSLLLDAACQFLKEHDND